MRQWIAFSLLLISSLILSLPVSAAVSSCDAPIKFGAPGLGEDVLQSIQTLNIGQGLQAGTAIVIVAIIIDRITQAFGQGKRARQKTIDAGRRPIG